MSEREVPVRRSARTGDVPGWMLALGVLAMVAAALGLASTGTVVGVVGVAVLLLALVFLLYSWCRATADEADRLRSDSA